MRIIAVNAAIEELSVELPEELVSGKIAPFLMSTSSSNPRVPDSDLPSPEDWEDNSIMASDSDIGITGSP